MIGRGGFLVALTAATGLHVAALGSVNLPQGSDGAGSGGADALSLAVAGAEVAALVEAWESQPDVSEATEAMEAPDATNAPELVATLDIAVVTAQPRALATTERPSPPKMAFAPDTAFNAPTVDTGPQFAAHSDTTLPTPTLEALARPDTPRPPTAETAAPDVPDFAVTASARPLSRPTKPAQQAVAMVAAGSGEEVTRGASANTAVRTQLSAKARASAQAAWAAAIQKQIARAQIYPRGARGDGRVRLAMTITATGKLAGVQVATSSGVAAFDKAALRAAKRAAPFPKAPDGLQKASFAFGQWVTFQR